MTKTIRITDLTEVPAFAPVTASRIWTAFWQDSGVELADLAARLEESLGPDPLPFTLVAHLPEGAEEEAFRGTVSVIGSDLETRPELGPWIAALWVAPEVRGRGLGHQLLQEAAARAFAAGIPELYLAAEPELRGFYEKPWPGSAPWVLVETGVEGLDVYRSLAPKG